MNQPDDRADLEVRERLAALRAELPDGGFQASLHRRLVAAGPPADPSPWARWRERLGAPAVFWPALGAAAGLAVFLLLSRPGPSAPEPRQLVATVVPATQVALVRLTLSADAPVDAALIRVTLPPGLSFWADGQALAQRDFEWTQPLASGDNEIPIAVRGQRPGRYRIAVDARIGGQQVEDEVVLEVTGG